MVKTTQQWHLASKPTDLPELSGPNQTFKLVTTDLPALETDQVLVKALYLSNDPAQRGWISPDADPERLYVPPVKVGTVMHARGLAEVVDSQSERFKKGDTVLGSVGWSEYAVLNAKDVQPAPDLPGGLSKTHYLGALGLTGITAYYGIKVVAETQASDTVVVSGAAGATGMMVVQIAKKMLGCKRVIGIAGTDAKCKWVESLGADICLNYKSSAFKDDLVRATEGFVDVYFDNVGGEILDLMFTRMARHSRIAACGAISAYNANSDRRAGLKNWFEVISMRIQVRGFIVLDYLSKMSEVLKEFRAALQEGKLKIDEQSEHVVEASFKEIPKTWLMLFDGSNTGKLVTSLR
ncbi:quinone oxidoreductase [Elasticomyces elasticus]|nr:hypothetical protein LTR28_007241 [Elasticomyces elasticus]KAK4988914.1 quinone oxidoreductase [Elasticomyces elasticus]